MSLESQFKTSSNHPRHLRLAVGVFVCLAAVLVLGLLVRQGNRAGHPQLVESLRKNLTLRAGFLYPVGSDVPFTGLVTDTYVGGELKSSSVVSNGLLQGWSKGWYTNGQQQVKEYYVAGTSHGLRTKWYQNGQKLSEVNIVAGKLSGTFQSWHENGECAEVVRLKDGQPDGLSKAYYPSGFLKAKVTLREGKVVAQQFWKDREFKEDVPTLRDLASSGSAN